MKTTGALLLLGAMAGTTTAFMPPAAASAQHRGCLTRMGAEVKAMYKSLWKSGGGDAGGRDSRLEITRASNLYTPTPNPSTNAAAGPQQPQQLPLLVAAGSGRAP